MDPNTFRLPDSSSRPPREERRRSVRQKLHTPVYVSFNGPQSGMVADLSELLDLHEHGFAVQTAIPTGPQRNHRLEVNHAVRLSLDLPETKKYVHGSGQVIWTDDTGRAGIRFSYLPDGSRQILKEWLFANLLVASTNYAARAAQLAHRRQEESGAPDSRPDDQLRMPTTTPLTMAASTPLPNVTAAALSDRAELLSALDDVRREVREIEALGSGAGAVLRLITERALNLTGAAGGALALLTGDRMLCRARAGDPAPPLGSEVDARTGLSGECIRSGLLVSCEDSGTDSRVDPEVCRSIGIGSFMAAPIFADFRVVGLLEVLSPQPHSFTKVQATILERLVELVPKIDKKKIEVTKLQPELPASSALEHPKLQLEEAQPEQAASVLQQDLQNQDEQNLDTAPAPASLRQLHITHLGLFLLVLGTIALVTGYLLAPTIQKHWMGPVQASQHSSPNAGQAASKDPSAPSVTSQGAANRRGHALSPQELRKLADQGDADAQYQLGILYHDGDVVPKDDAQAVQWFQRAADQGYVRAQSTLGAYYWAGRGVAQDFSKAYFWSQLALAQGDENSKSRLEGLSAQMTPSQVATARQQAEAWLQSHNQAANSKPK